MKFKFLPIILTCLLILSCGSDDENNDDDDPQNPTQVMTITKNGDSFDGTNFNNTLISLSQFGEPGKRLDLRAQIDGGTLIVSISNFDFQNPPEDGVLIKSYDTNGDETSPNTICMEDGGINYCDGGLVTYILGESTYISELDGDELGTITISANDPTNRLVSGSLDVMLRDFGSANTEVMTMTGTFENLNYISN